MAWAGCWFRGPHSSWAAYLHIFCQARGSRREAWRSFNGEADAGLGRDPAARTRGAEARAARAPRSAGRASRSPGRGLRWFASSRRDGRRGFATDVISSGELGGFATEDSGCAERGKHNDSTRDSILVPRFAYLSGFDGSSRTGPESWSKADHSWFRQRNSHSHVLYRLADDVACGRRIGSLSFTSGARLVSHSARLQPVSSPPTRGGVLDSDSHWLGDGPRTGAKSISEY